MPGCSVPHCHRRADKGYRMFIFPKKPERRKLWTQLCNREDKPPPKHARMCEYHFDDNQFEINSKRRRRKLKSNAIPTVFDAPSPARVDTSEFEKKDDNLQKNYIQVNRPEGTSEGIIINCPLDLIKPEFVDVSQHDDDLFWRNDFNVDSLHDERNLDNIEQLYDEPQLVVDNFKRKVEGDDTLMSQINNVQTIIDRNKDLEEQLRKKDKELVKTQRLLSKTLKQVKRLKAVNEKFETQISELSKESNSKKYSSGRKRIKPAKFFN